MNLNFSMTEIGESFTYGDNFGGISMDNMYSMNEDGLNRNNFELPIKKKVKKVKKSNKSLIGKLILMRIIFII